MRDVEKIMEEIIVSVYCLAYNHEKYIRDALEGFINQKTNFNFEVIVHDDASTDNTKIIIEEYAKKYPNLIIPIYQVENTHRKGIDKFKEFIYPKMRGKYVAICEGDDFWTDENKLQIQVDYLNSHPDYSACVHNTKQIDMATGKETLMYNNDYERDLSFEEIVKRGGACYHTTSLMYRIQYADNRPHFFEVIKPIGDYPLSIYLILNGKIHFINKIMSCYRLGTEYSWSKSNMNKDNRILRTKKIIQMLNEVNEYSNYKYEQVINSVISQNEFLQLEYEGKYSDLRNKKFNGIWQNESNSFRLKRFLWRYFGSIIELLRK